MTYSVRSPWGERWDFGSVIGQPRSASEPRRGALRGSLALIGEHKCYDPAKVSREWQVVRQSTHCVTTSYFLLPTEYTPRPLIRTWSYPSSPPPISSQPRRGSSIPTATARGRGLPWPTSRATSLSTRRRSTRAAYATGESYLTAYYGWHAHAHVHAHVTCHMHILSHAHAHRTCHTCPCACHVTCAVCGVRLTPGR